MKTFVSPGGSSRPVLRHLCPECGSSIAEEASTAPGLVIVNVARYPRRPEIGDAGPRDFCDDALSWVQVTGGLPRFARMPV